MPRTLALLATLAVTTLGLAGCGGLPATVHVNASASADLNPGPRGSAFPAQVRLYLLRAQDKFVNADYFQLADHEASVLGNDLVSREELTMHPGDTRIVDLPTKPDTRFVGVAVAYRNLDSATWRAVTPVRGSLKLALGADSVTLGPR